MPLLGFAASQPCSCFFNNLVDFRSEINAPSKILVSNGRGLGWASTFYWNTICVTKKVAKESGLGRFEVRRSRLMIKAVATLEISGVGCKNEVVKGYQSILAMDIDSGRPNSPVPELKSSSEDSAELSDREKLRRKRISKANKGNTPWNKGRKHSPETRQRIKERTKLAMQDPKVKMKLVNFGHSQSEETRIKIGMGVRLGWERRRERLMLQETCHYEWLNLIANSAQKGLLGEEELQWDAYKTLSEQLEQEWLQSVEKRKNMPRHKGNKRAPKSAPKSAEQRRKISEAISAKWADPDYSNRVCSSLAQFHRTAERPERPERKPSGDRPIQKRICTKKDKTSFTENHETNQVQRARLKRPRGPAFKDPFASSKLEMIKTIRAQRAASVSKRSEAIFKAKLLIAEAEKAAAALEPAAQSNPRVQASLAESRMLIAEAIQFLESINDEEQEEDAVTSEDHNSLPLNSTEPGPNPINQIPKVNGVHTSKLDVVINGNASKEVNFLSLDSNHDTGNIPESPKEQHTKEKEIGEAGKGVKIMKKWVRGKLVEVVEGFLD